MLVDLFCYSTLFLCTMHSPSFQNVYSLGYGQFATRTRIDRRVRVGILESILYKNEEKVGILSLKYVISNDTRECYFYFVRGWVIIIYYLSE